jgi:hypothetical protein
MVEHTWGRMSTVGSLVLEIVPRSVEREDSSRRVQM